VIYKLIKLLFLGNTMRGSDASTSIPEDSESGAVDPPITPESGYNDDCPNGTDNAKNTDETRFIFCKFGLLFLF
jgi:hypothetical protein